MPKLYYGRRRVTMTCDGDGKKKGV